MRSSSSLSRGMDYLGALARTLGDLTGYSILAFELIQNGDDAGASQLVFTFTDDALEIWNDGVFSDCERQELDPDECPMRTSEGHRCDFHSFRSVSSEDKRQRDHTIGAFGIGFTAVYQITDRPELISSRRHWVVSETNPESERIGVCDGCSRCDSNPSGTTFILPWARDEGSPLRTRLSAPAVGPDEIDELRRELVESLPTTVLFLRNLDELEVRNGLAPMCRVERVPEDDRTLVQVNDQVETWLVLRGSFDEEAQALKARYGDKIEASRHHEVVVAVPVEHPVDGRLCAYLPTRESTGLPFHVNADFFPASDRTRLPDEGHRGEWNRAAVRAAAQLLARRLPDLREPLGPRRLWELVYATWQRRSQVGEGSRRDWMGSFWSELAAVLADCPVFHTSAGEWVRCRDGVTIRHLDEERASIPFLEWLGMNVVDPELHSIIYGLERVEVLRTREISFASFVEALRENGFASGSAVELQPALREQAWRELDILLGRKGADGNLLDDIALAPTVQGGLVAFAAARRADVATQSIFRSLADDVPFVDDAELRSVAPRLAGLVDDFHARDAVALLERLDDVIDTAHLPVLLRWFSDRSYQVDDGLGQRLVTLPIFPTTAGPKALVDLSIPGGFDDELGLAEVVDTAAISSSLSFLRQLGARELTIEEYARRVVPANVHVAESDPSRWRRVVELLARAAGDLRDESGLRSVLSRLPLVETGESFVESGRAYIPSSELDAILVDYLAVKAPSHESVASFYEWLGVATKPRPEDLLRRVDHLAAGPVTPEVIRNVEAIMVYLAEARDAVQATVRALSRKAWLPAEGDDSRWYLPGDLAASYQRYLFETQAMFVRLPISLQQTRGVNDVFGSLGVQTVPRPEQVVEHLLKCAGSSVALNKDVYRYLNNNTESRALDRLVGRHCILAPNGTYLRPGEIFRRAHPFGRFRAVLGSELRGLDSLWERLGIRESPEASDAVDVLRDIGEEFGVANDALDTDNFAVVMEAWRMIERGLDGTSDRNLRSLETVKCVPDSRHVLVTPERALFDDAPEYADALHNRIGGMLIRKPEGAWRAMERAGVRSLAEGVQVELHEAVDEVEDTEVGHLITERRRQIARAVDPLLSNSGAGNVLAILDRLSFTRVSRLEVVYRMRLPGSNVDLQSDVLPATTVLLEDRILRCGDAISGVDLARELARRIAPSVERTSLVPALALALQAGTPEQADRALDSSGVPRLDLVVVGSVDPAVLDVLGGEDLSDEEIKEYFGRADTSGSMPADRDRTGGESSHPTGELSAPSDEFGKGAVPVGDAGAGELSNEQYHWKKAGTSTRQTHLRSYVSPLGSSESETRPRQDDDRGKTDAAGIEVVLSYERSCGREPMRMLHHHPGYDIESRDADGEIVRYIEVKSLTGAWTDLGAGVSAAQYRTGAELRDHFWLYVVEHAVSDPQVYPIHDPVGKTDQFMFDHNWKLVAEPRRRILADVDVVLATAPDPGGGMVRVPLFSADGDAIHAREDVEPAREFVDVGSERVRFVWRTSDGRLWPMGDPPHDRDRSGRLLLVEYLREGASNLALGWYRSFAYDRRSAVEISPEGNPAGPTLLFPEYEADVAVLGEAVGRPLWPGRLGGSQ